MTAASTELKSCCAAAYSTTAARFLLGDSFHPGGSQLTSRLIRDLGVGEGSTVVDVASGLGTSALQLAHELGCPVGLAVVHTVTRTSDLLHPTSSASSCRRRASPLPQTPPPRRA
jgi:hypothetical protein